MTWQDIKRRCLNPKYKDYSNWGGRGVKLEWESFEQFQSDVVTSFLFHIQLHGIGNTSLDRVNPKGNYSKENCRWATMDVQRKNRREIKLESSNCKLCKVEFNYYPSEQGGIFCSQKCHYNFK